MSFSANSSAYAGGGAKPLRLRLRDTSSSCLLSCVCKYSVYPNSDITGSAAAGDDDDDDAAAGGAEVYVRAGEGSVRVFWASKST